jgi:UrcA family protein
MKTLLTLAAFAATLTAAPAFAQPPVSTEIVRTADLDLRSPVGVATLDRRIQAAVQAASGETSDADVHGKNVASRCRAETLAAVAEQRAQAITLARRSTGTIYAAQ